MIKFNISGHWDYMNYAVEKTIKRILKIICKIEKIKSKHVISYIFVTNEEIHDINLKYRNVDHATDVISFAMIDGEVDRQLPQELGDIFISIDKIRSQAIEYGHSELREFAFLVTHGTLHLLGYDHINPNDEAVMFALQNRVLEILKISR